MAVANVTVCQLFINVRPALAFISEKAQGEQLSSLAVIVAHPFSLFHQYVAQVTRQMPLEAAHRPRQNY